MFRVRRCRVGVALVALSMLTGTACAGPDEFAQAPTMLEASATHPLAAPPRVLPSASPSPASGAGGRASSPAALPGAPRTAPVPTRTSPIRTSAPPSTPAPDGLSVRPSASVAVSPSRPPRHERPGWIQHLVQDTNGRDCEERPVSERNDDRAFTVQRLEFRSICFSGLAEEPAPELVLSAPDGGQFGMRAERDFGFSFDEGIWAWSFQPGLIGDELGGLGTYHFELTGTPEAAVTPGAESTLSGRITVVPCSEPRISFTFHPEHNRALNFTGRGMRAGGEVAVQFAGYLPGSRHLLTVYVPDPVEPGSKPIEDLPEVVIPPAGEAVIYWKSATTALPGLYGIWVQSTPFQIGGCNADLCETFEIEQ